MTAAPADQARSETRISEPLEEFRVPARLVKRDQGKTRAPAPSPKRPGGPARSIPRRTGGDAARIDSDRGIRVRSLTRNVVQRLLRPARRRPDTDSTVAV